MATATVDYPAQSFGFQLRSEPNFTPPAAVDDLRDEVELDLSRGEQVLWTVVMGRENRSAILPAFIGLSKAGARPHQFADSSFGDDSEIGSGFSNQFSKVVGLAFMDQYVGVAWFTVLKGLWGGVLRSALGDIDVDKKDESRDGPDYLAAPFDPASAEYGGPFYAVEFKGHKAKVELHHAEFDKWMAQAANIRLARSSRALDMKSWVLAFNYGFEKPRGSRETSTLLVADPESAPGEGSLERDASNGEWIIRDHLARQCSWLGASNIAPFVRDGVRPESTPGLPALFEIKHPALSGRSYIGSWFHRQTDGALTAACTGALQSMRWKQVGRDCGEFFLEHRNARPRGYFEGDAAFLAEILGGPNVFIGQDATMLRKCMQTPRGTPLSGEAFTREISLKAVIGGDDSPPASLSVLRSGNVVASSSLVTRMEESEAIRFWRDGSAS